MRDILKLAFGGGCEVVLSKLNTNQVLSRAGLIIMMMMIRMVKKTTTMMAYFKF